MNSKKKIREFVLLEKSTPRKCLISDPEVSKLSKFDFRVRL